MFPPSKTIPSHRQGLSAIPLLSYPFSFQVPSPSQRWDHLILLRIQFLIRLHHLRRKKEEFKEIIHLQLLQLINSLLIHIHIHQVHIHILILNLILQVMQMELQDQEFKLQTFNQLKPLILLVYLPILNLETLPLILLGIQALR